MTKKVSCYRNPVIIHDTYAEIVLEDHKGKSSAYVKVDLDDLDRIGKYRWCRWDSHKCSNTYAQRSTTGSPILMHTEILKTIPDASSHIDHINGDGHDNRKNNLRILPAGLNTSRGNRRRSHGNQDLPRGTTPQGKSYLAQIGIDGRARYMGVYKTPKEAGDAYQIARMIKYFAYLDAVEYPRYIEVTEKIEQKVVHGMTKHSSLTKEEVLTRLGGVKMHLNGGAQ